MSEYCCLCDRLAVDPVSVPAGVVCAAHKQAWDDKEALLDRLLEPVVPL